jgi:dynein heavy chain, axonemal
LVNASKLLVLLEEEGERWAKALAVLDEQAQYHTGNVFVATSTLSYLGAFTGRYRAELEETWTNYCKDT